jgi:cullin 3
VASTADRLLPILDQHLLANHLETILNMPGSGLVTMIDDGRIADLHRLYELFGRPRIPEGLEVLKIAMKKTIQARGSGINASVLSGGEVNQGGPTAETPVQGTTTSDTGSKPKKPTLSGAAAVAAALRWVQEVVDLKDKFDRVLKEAFEENKGLQMAMNEVGPAGLQIGESDRMAYKNTRRIRRHFKRSSTRTHGVKSSSRYLSTKTSRRGSRG